MLVKNITTWKHTLRTSLIAHFLRFRKFSAVITNKGNVKSNALIARERV